MMLSQKIQATLSDWYRTDKGLYLVLIPSALFKILLIVFGHDQVINIDGIRYISAAQEYAEGNFKAGLALYRMPLYPLLIAAIFKVIPHWIVAARCLSLLALTVAVVPLYLMTKRLFDQRAAFWAAIAFAFSPFNHQMTLNVYREPVFACLFIWCVFVIHMALTTKRLKWFAVATIMTMLPVFFRVEGIILPVLFPLILIGLVMIKPAERRDYLKGLALWAGWYLFCISIAFLSLQSTFFSFIRFGDITHQFYKVLTFDFLDNYHLLEKQLKAMDGQAAIPRYGRNFTQIARQYMWLIYIIRILHSTINVLSPFLLLPLAFGIRQIMKKSTIHIALILFCYLLMVYAFYIKRDFLMDRFLFSSTLLIFPFVGIGMVHLLARFESFGQPVRWKTAVILLVVVSSLIGCRHAFEQRNQVVNLAADWLRQHGLQNAKIIETDLRISFTAGRAVYRDMGDTYIYHQPHDKDYGRIESIALNQDMDLIMIKVRKRRLDLLPQIQSYVKIRRFIGPHKIIDVYASPAFFRENKTSFTNDEG